MSSSDAPTYTLTVSPPNSMAEVTVISGKLAAVAKGAGYCSFQLPSGIYMVRISSGASMVEEPPFLLDGDRTVSPHWNPQTTGDAPTAESATSHEYQSGPAEQLSRTPVVRGHGAGLLLFVRNSGGGRRWEAPRISIRDQGHREIASLRDDIAVTDEGACFSALSLILDPGYYRIRREGDPATEIGVWLPRPSNLEPGGWQTQVFVTDSPDNPGLALGECSILMSPLRRGFVATNPGAIVGEQTRQALLDGQRRLHDEFIGMVANGKYENPLLGIAALLMLLRQEERPQANIDTILANTSTLLGPEMPDLQILSAYGSSPIFDQEPIELPPIFAGSLRHLPALDQGRRGSIDTNGLLAKALPWLAPSRLWTVWRKQFRDLEPAARSIDHRLRRLTQVYRSEVAAGVETISPLDVASQPSVAQMFANNAAVPEELRSLYHEAAQAYE